MTGFTVSGKNDTLFLPQEISDYILQYIRDDILSLRNSGLVCQSWYFASHAWLYQEITLNRSNYSSLLTLLREHQGCSVVSACKLLHIRFVDFRTLPTPLLRPVFTSLTQLCIRRATYNSLAHLFEFISNFPQLRSLSMKDIFWCHDTLPDTLPPCPTIDSVEVLGRLNYTLFFDALAKSKVFPNLLHLNIGPLVAMIDMPGLGTYMHCHGPASRLQSFQLSYICEGTFTACLPEVVVVQTLGTCTAGKGAYDYKVSPLRQRYEQIFGMEACLLLHPDLLALRINGFIDVRNISQSTALFWTPRILSSMHMPRLKSIVLTLTIHRAGQMNHFGINWSFIDFALSSKEFINLEELVFIIAGTTDVVDIEDTLRTILPMAAKRGIIKIHLDEDEGCD